VRAPSSAGSGVIGGDGVIARGRCVFLISGPVCRGRLVWRLRSERSVRTIWPWPAEERADRRMFSGWWLWSCHEVSILTFGGSGVGWVRLFARGQTALTRKHGAPQSRGGRVRQGADESSPPSNASAFAPLPQSPEMQRISERDARQSWSRRGRGAEQELRHRILQLM
jgi:hypothetical protein